MKGADEIDDYRVLVAPQTVWHGHHVLQAAVLEAALQALGRQGYLPDGGGINHWRILGHA
jgi:hypothetical protein